MAQYSVTITPFLENGSDEDTASRTTMRVVAGDGPAYIKELTVRAKGTSGLSEAIQVDLDALLQAFTRQQLGA